MKTIQIPKVDKDCKVEVIKSKCSKYEIVLKRQTIAGLIIPKDSVISFDWESFYDYQLNLVTVPPNLINKLLKFVYLEKLRNDIL